MPMHPQVRKATIDDLSQLLVIEKTCFTSDQMSKRSFKRFLQEGSHDLLVFAEDHTVIGYVLNLYRNGTNLARMYSIAIHPNFQGKGYGNILMDAGEKAARDRHCVYLRLEVAVKNKSAIALYNKLGYREIDQIEGYYEDGSDALRMEKRIHQLDSSTALTIPYYEQTTEFTCGPASLMMAMKTLTPEHQLSRHEELNIWREATTIFMTSGHGGCSPHGLALSAWRRGYNVTLYINQADAPFMDGVRDEEKKSVIQLTFEDFMSQIEQTDINLRIQELSSDELKKLLQSNKPVLALISTWRLDRKKSPHWVYIARADDDFVYINDPDIDEDYPLLTETDYREVPIDINSFTAMTKFGQKRLRSFIVLDGLREPEN